jgi:GTP-binding protein
LLDAAERSAESAWIDMPTSRMNEVLAAAVAENPPPVARGRRVKLSYAHQGGRNPPIVVVHGNQTERLPDNYRRFLINRFRKVFRLTGAPVRLELVSGSNPFAGKRNQLTPRQIRRRQRVRSRS